MQHLFHAAVGFFAIIGFTVIAAAVVGINEALFIRRKRAARNTPEGRIEMRRSRLPNHWQDFAIDLRGRNN